MAKYEEAKVNVRDEQTVNQCLINLMLSITWPFGVSDNTDPQREAFEFILDDIDELYLVLSGHAGCWRVLVSHGRTLVGSAGL